MDFDCKKRQGANDEDVRKAEEKFAESLHLAQLGNLIWRRKKNQFNLKKIFNFTNFFFFIRYAQSTRWQRSRTYFAINTIFRGKKCIFFNVFETKFLEDCLKVVFVNEDFGAIVIYEQIFSLYFVYLFVTNVSKLYIILY